MGEAEDAAAKAAAQAAAQGAGAAAAANAPSTLDFRRPVVKSDTGVEQVVGLTPQPSTSVPQYSQHWAKLARPFAYLFLLIIALAMFLPFLFVWNVPAPVVNIPATASTPEMVDAAARAVVDERMRTAMDWAKTILPSAIGFGSAIVAYFFGARHGSEGSNQAPTK